MCAKDNYVHVDLLLLFTAHTRIRSKLVIFLYLYTHWKAFHIIIIRTSSLSVHFSFFICLSLSLYRLCLYHDRVPFICSSSFI